MRSTAAFIAVALGLLAACDSPPAQSPPDDNLINATDTDQAFPSQATGNDIVTGDDTAQGGSGNATGAATAQHQDPPPQ